MTGEFEGRSYPFAQAFHYARPFPAAVLGLKAYPTEGVLLSESLPSSDPGAQKRRSTRIVQAVPITVSGVDALGQPFKERTTTVAVNCHGCKYQSKHYVPKNSAISLEIPRQEAASPPRVATGHVVWVQRPRTVRELFQIGVEFETAGNVWGIAFPPGDWFPYPEDQISAVPSSAETPPVEPHTAEDHAATIPFTTAPPEKRPEMQVSSATLQVAPATPAAKLTPPAMETFGATPAPAGSVDENKIHVMPAPAQSQEAQLAFSRQMAKMVAEAKETLDKTIRRGAQTAINEEMTVVRQQLDAQLHETIEHAIKTSMERVSEAEVKKVVMQATLRTSAIVEEARKASESASAQLDAKIQRAVQQTVGDATEKAAKDAAHQAAGQNLQQMVEQAVQRALAEQATASPSLQILSSPEAARKHLDEWKKNLEETAQGIRSQEIEQSRSAADSASRRWREEFEAAVAASSKDLHETLTRVSQEAATRAEREIAERSASFRAMLHEAVSGTQTSVQSLGAELARERARAEETKEHLAETARSALEQTRRQLDDLLSAQREDISRRTDEIVAARAQQIEPVLRNSSQAALDRFAGEMDRQLAPKLEEAQRAASELADARETASRLPGDIRDQMQRISQKTLEESAERLRQETARSLAEFEQSRRASIEKIEEELEQKSSETQHATYDALLKASEWYQKKAQTSMQSALEKAAEQSVSTLRDRAGEISRLVTSELDHYRRTYVEHGKAEMEEAAKEVAELERKKLNENAETTNAALADRIHQAAAESLRKFQEASREAIEKARSDMEYNREGLVAEFQKKIDERMTQGAEHAATYLQSQLVPLLETWETQREEERRAWTAQLRKAEEEAIEQYKIRLENATNSWLLASAATLGQNSQAVLDTLARTAEKRLRDTCSRVLAGMGDTLKQSLLGISGDLSLSEEDEPFKSK